MNNLVLLGRATSEIELKQTQVGKSVVSFSLAVKRPFAKDTTDFFNIVAWDKQAELLSKYVNKGDQICIRGHLTTRTWNDKQGNKRYATEVVANEVSFCEAKGSVTVNDTPHYANRSQGSFGGSQPSFEEIGVDDDFPF